MYKKGIIMKIILGGNVEGGKKGKRSSQTWFFLGGGVLKLGLDSAWLGTVKMMAQ